MAKVKRHFSKEFKQEAVGLSCQPENIKDLADELGIQVAQIYKCRKAERNTITTKSSIKPQYNQEVK